MFRNFIGFEPVYAPPVDAAGAVKLPEDDRILDLPGGEGGEGPPTAMGGATMDAEVPPEVPPEAPPAVPDPNAALMEQMEVLKQQNAVLMEQMKATKSDNEGLKEENKSILDLEHDDLVAMVTENPHGFVQSLTEEISKGILSKVESQKRNDERNSSIESTIDSYASEHKDFEAMWEDGSIGKYMDKNPGHNAISAHLMLTLAGKLAAAEKKGAEEAAKNFTTKMGSQTLGSGVNIPPNQRDAAIKDTKKFGGRARVAAMRAGLI